MTSDPMERISINTDKSKYMPGEIIVAKISIKLVKKINIRGIYLSLYCCEKKKKKRYTHIDYDEAARLKSLGMPPTVSVKEVGYFTECNIQMEEKKIMDSGEIQNKDFESYLTIPKNSEPTSYIYGHDNKISIWRIKVRIDMPLKRDLNCEKEVFVDGF